MNLDYRNPDQLARFNEKERTIAEIFEAVEKAAPMVVRSYDQGEDAAVLVTGVNLGLPYGYPLHKGIRARNSWYGPEAVGAVRIPEGLSRIWTLVALPFDDMEKILFRADLHGTAETSAPRAEVKPAAAPREEKKPAAPASLGGLFGYSNDNDTPKPAAAPAVKAASQAAEKAAAAKVVSAARPAAAPAARTVPDDGIDPEAVLTFGKYKGKTVADVRRKDSGYIDWALQNISAFRETVTLRRVAA